MKNIRKINESDKNIYLELMQEFFSSDAVLHPIPLEYMIKTFEVSVSDSPLSECFIFEYDNRPAGYGLISPSYSNECGGEVIWLEEIYVRPDYRSKGFGKAFFSLIEELYKGRLKRIRLEVEEDNGRAIELYKNLGYDVIEYIQMYKDFE